jgi:hypothetical protein
MQGIASRQSQSWTPAQTSAALGSVSSVSRNRCETYAADRALNSAWTLHLGAEEERRAALRRQSHPGDRRPSPVSTPVPTAERSPSPTAVPSSMPTSIQSPTSSMARVSTASLGATPPVSSQALPTTTLTASTPVFVSSPAFIAMPTISSSQSTTYRPTIARPRTRIVQPPSIPVESRDDNCSGGAD